MKRTKKALCMLVLLAFVMFALPMTVFAASKPKITKQPVAAAVYNGGTATFKVTATGAKSYQWQYRTSTTGKWMNATATGNKTATLKVGATISRHGNQYRCAVKNATGTTYSNAVKLTVKFKTNPSNPTVVSGKPVSFKVLTGCKAYQWQYRTSSSTTWKNATGTGNKTATLKFNATPALGGRQYRCKVTTKRGVIYSDVSTLYVAEPTLAITKQPVDQSALKGSSAKFTVTGTAIASYQWQWRASAENVWANTTATGCKTATLTVPATFDRQGYQYQCVVTDKYGATMNTSPATLNVYGVVTQPKNYTGGASAAGAFKVEAVGAESYQWQYRTSASGSWANATATGNKTFSLDVPATQGRDGYQYRCVMTAANGAKFYTNAVTLNYVPKFEHVSHTYNDFYLSTGENIVLTVKVTGGKAPYTAVWEIGGKSEPATSNTTTITLSRACTANDFGKIAQLCELYDSSGQELNVKVETDYVRINEYKELEVGGSPKVCLEDYEDYGAIMPMIYPTINEVGSNDLSYEWQYAPGTIAKTNLNENNWKTLPLNIDSIINTEDVTVAGAYGTMDKHSGSLVYLNDEIYTLIGSSKGVWLRCKVTDNDKGGYDYSNVGAIYLSSLAVAESSNSVKQQSAYGYDIYLNATVTGGMGPYAYQWYRTGGIQLSNSSDFSGCTSSSLQIDSSYVAVNSRANLYCVITDAFGSTVNSGYYTILSYNDNI